MTEVAEKAPNLPDQSIELQGAFVLMVAALETMLNDTYIYYLRSSPEAFDFKDVKFSKEDVLGATLSLDLIERQIEKNVLTQGHGRFRDLLTSFVKTLGLPKAPVDDDLIERIVEIKETRNLVLHNELYVNNLYISKAGRFGRAHYEGEKLPLSRAYVSDSCQFCLVFLQELEHRVNDKYVSFTKVRALRELWNYLFSSPIMPFDDFWIVNAEKDEVTAIKESPWEEKLASSELAFLAVWRRHFNGWQPTPERWSMYALSEDKRRKMLWFLATLSDFDVR